MRAADGEADGSGEEMEEGDEEGGERDGEAEGEASGGEGGGEGGGPDGGEGGDGANRAALRRHNEIMKAEHAQLVHVRRLAALQRLCTANGLVSEGNKYQLLARLVNTEKHGRAKPCPRCEANLHLVCTPSDLQPNEVTKLVCRHWNYRGGKREPCGCRVDITSQNKASLLCLPLVDSAERDLAAAAKLAEAVKHTEGEAEGGGEGGEVGEANGGGEGGQLAVAEAVEKPWAPKDTEELLHAIATKDYGVSQDRSWSKVYPKAIQTYNGVADKYHQSVQKHGQPLHEGFWIVKVQFASLPHAHLSSPAIWWGGPPTRCNLPHARDLP